MLWEYVRSEVQLFDEHWSGVLERYLRKIVLSTEPDAYALRYRLGRARAFARSPEGWTLDTGCGAIEPLLIFSEQANVVGLDISKFALKALRKFGWRGNSVLASVEDLPFADDAFDKVLCCEVIEHLRKPRKAIRELLRVCRGMFMITTPDGYHPYPTHRAGFTRQKLAEALKPHKFKFAYYPNVVEAAVLLSKVKLPVLARG